MLSRLFQGYRRRRLPHIWPILLFAEPGIAGTLTTLVKFDGANGRYPASSVVRNSAGDLFGTTDSGGAINEGTLFQLTASGALTTLVTFGTGNGFAPKARLLLDAEEGLYGTTSYGGPQNVDGTLFHLDPVSLEFLTIAQFNPANSDMSHHAMVQDGMGNLYGSSPGGGPIGAGVVFMVPAGTGDIQVLTAFVGTNFRAPGELAIDSKGNLFGVTAYGGDQERGSVFRIEAQTHAFSVITDFSNSNVEQPFGSLLLDGESKLIGTTSKSIFSVDLQTSEVSILSSFASSGTNGPNGGLIFDAAGNIFGVTGGGGATPYGTIFRIDSATRVLESVFEFNGSNGTWPNGPLVVGDRGKLYGTTLQGGLGPIGGDGTVFELTSVGFVYSCMGDLNRDGYVELSDLAILLNNFGQGGADETQGDLDSDADVDLNDLVLLLARYGEVCIN